MSKLIYTVVYGAKSKVFKALDKARNYRDKKRKKYSDISIVITQEDIDPYGDHFDINPYSAKQNEKG